MLYFMLLFVLAVSEPVMEPLVTINVTSDFENALSLTYGPYNISAPCAALFHLTYSNCLVQLAINATGMIPGDEIRIDSSGNPTAEIHTIGKGPSPVKATADLQIKTTKPPPFLRTTFIAVNGSEMSFSFKAEKICEEIDKEQNEPKLSSNSPILSSISCLLLYVLMK